MKLIPLTRGRFTIVDDDDYELLSKLKWCVDGKGYATRKMDGKVITMHRFILNYPNGLQVDHANSNRLDNRRSNIRVASRAQNQQNSKARKGAVGLKGVSFEKGSNRYRARITVTGKTIYLGGFLSAESAHKAYATAAEKYFGEFARTA